jgi:hypothetical protein
MGEKLEQEKRKKDYGKYRITMKAGITSKCPGKIVIDFARRKMKTSSERVTIALVLSTRHSRFGCSCFA